MMATDATVNCKTISHGTGQQEHDHELPSRPRPAGTRGPAHLRPCLVRLSMLILLPA